MLIIARCLGINNHRPALQDPFSPSSRIAPCREFTITVECKKSRIVCVEGIRQTSPSATHCSLPRVYNYCRMQESNDDVRSGNSSDLTAQHIIIASITILFIIVSLSPRKQAALPRHVLLSSRFRSAASHSPVRCRYNCCAPPHRLRW